MTIGGLPAERRRVACCALLFASHAIAGCTNPAPDPISTAALLSELREVQLGSALPPSGSTPGPTPGPSLENDGISIDDAVAVALHLNPELRAARSSLGIAHAEVVIAGLYPSAELGADLADLGVLSSELDDDGHVDGIDLSSGPLDWVAGIDLTYPLPRPGERDARTDAATARLEAARADIAQAEWRLVGDVRRAFIEQIGADNRLDLMDRSAEIARRTRDFFERSRQLGAATALEANLAALDFDLIEERREGLRVARRLAAQTLNALLGVPPEPALTVRISGDLLDPTPPWGDPGTLVEQALLRRPDIAVLRARYDETEAELRLQISRRWPGITVGTAISIELPFFSQMNEPAIQAALARRAQVADQLRANVHQLRAEVHRALALWEQCSRRADYFQRNTAPHVQLGLKLAEESIAARELTLLDALITQRQALDAQERQLELRLAAAHAAVAVRTAIADGLPAFSPSTATEEAR